MACIKQHYLAYSEEEIERFIINVINGEDSKLKERTDFINANLMRAGKLPSEVIIEDLRKSIKG